MDFIIRLLGLDAKARGPLVGYRTYIFLAGLLCFHLGPVLIAIGNALVLLSEAIFMVTNFVDGGTGLMAFVSAFKTKLASIWPVLFAAHADWAWCCAILAAAYWKASNDRTHAAVADTMAASAPAAGTLPPSLEPSAPLGPPVVGPRAPMGLQSPGPNSKTPGTP